LWKERGAAEQPESKHEEEYTRNGEVAARQQPEFDDRLLLPDFPYNGRDPSDDPDREHPADKRTPEPVFDLTAQVDP
jgi:hypothetical protein